MALNWIIFAAMGFCAYAVLAFMASLTGAAAHSTLGAAFNLFKPYALLALIIGNALWAMALFWGLKETRDAIPMLVAIGVVTSFMYSALFLGDEVTVPRLMGLALVFAGIYLLS